MNIIKLTTLIDAPISIVFDASRNIDVHLGSASESNEKAIAGRTSGLINLHETVTWRGKHFGLYLTHQSKITEFEYPVYFVDEMIQGHFKSFRHQHIFKETTSGTEMIDILCYETPFGLLGRLFDSMLLKKHLTDFLTNRNHYLNNFCFRESK